MAPAVSSLSGSNVNSSLQSFFQFCSILLSYLILWCGHFLQIQSELNQKVEEFKVQERKLNIQVSELSVELTTNQKQLATNKEEKLRADTRHQSEISALSTNLASLRQQLTTTKNKLGTAEEMLSQQSSQLNGELKRGVALIIIIIG